MRIPFATAGLSAVAALSIAMLSGQPAHAQACHWFEESVFNLGAFCGPAKSACRKKLEADATAGYAYWESPWPTNYRFYSVSGAKFESCHSHMTIVCLRYICKAQPPGQAHPKLDPSAPFPRGLIPPKTQAHPPLDPSKHPGWGVHLGPHIPK